MSLKRYKVTGVTAPVGSWLSKSVYDARGELLAEAGSTVNGVLLERLRHIEELEVFVDVKDNIEEPKAVGHKDFVLEESIRERVVDSVKYIYSGISNSEVAYESSRIADTICEVIGDADGGFNIENLRQYDEYTYRHSVDVALMGAFLAKALELPEQVVKEVALAGIIHDLGKTRIPLEILNKQGKLTGEEFEIMKSHSLYSYEIIKDEKSISDAVKYGVLTHHEIYSGGGYVLGLSRRQIPAYGRLIAIADYFDALVTDRPYRAGMSAYEAVSIMKDDAGHFDSFLLSGFISFLVLYPVGTCVVLSDGSTCVVTGQVEGFPYRPYMRNVSTGEAIDLVHDLQMRGIKIQSVLQEQAWG